MKQSALEAVLPLSPLQEGMLFHALYDETGVDVYNVQTPCRLDGPLDAEAMRAACQGVVDRHAALRAGFVQRRSGQTVQAVPRTVAVPFELVDLTGTAAPERAAALEELLVADRMRRFEMAVPPLVRFTLVRLGADEHVLVFTHHHILLDGWSLPLVFRDLFALYAGRGAHLPPAVPYRNYLSWLSKQDPDVSEAAWRDALAGLEEPTRVAPHIDTAGNPVLPRRATLHLTAELTGVLAGWARGCGLTLNSVVQGAWALLLGGLTGRGDVVFGATVAGRPASLAGVEDVVGLLMNTVPVRVCLSGSESVSGLLARVQREQSGLGAHHHVGLARIQRLAGLGELFDTSTVFENAPFDREGVHAALPGLRISGIDDSAAPEGTHYPLSLAAFPGERLRLELNYRPDVFTAEQAELITERLRRLLEIFAEAPDTPVGRLPFQTEAERAQLVENYNATRVELPGGTLPELFARQAAETPDATAVVFEDETLSYAQLDAAADALARRLVRLGAGADRFVALVLPRGADAVVAILGALKSGAAYVPIDAGDPAERVAELFADIRPFAVITTSEVAARLGLGGETALLFVDETWSEHDAESAGLDRSEPDVSESWRVRPPAPRDLAYAIYTSGSTGRPKAVAVEHRNLADMFHSHHRNFFAPEAAAAGRRLRVALTNALTFDASWSQLLWMVAGHELHLVADDMRRDARAVVDYVGKHEIDLLDTTPSYARELLTAGLLDGAAHRPSVLALGGEAIGEAMWDELRASDFESVYNLYGPTECTIDAMFARVRDTELPALGHPAANTRVYVLDGWLRPVPAGVTGELYIGGAGLARGYWGRAGLTASRFVADPFSASGERLYRTGDMAMWDASDRLVFAGRVDDQVKVRGFRVELGEVEAALASVAGVGQAVVVAREDRPGVKRLIGYVVPAPETTLDGAQVRSALARRLPDYLVPSVVAVLGQLPLTAHGKVDRKALPTVTVTGSGAGRDPSSPAEEALCALFGEVLGVERVGVEDGFFELGGDSITSIQLVARARRAGLALTARDVFAHRTVAALAQIATPLDDSATAAGAGRLGTAGRRVLLELEPGEIDHLGPFWTADTLEEALPLAPLQQGFLFHALYDESGVDVYNMQAALDLDGPLDAAVLRQAAERVVERHACLRAGFPTRPSGDRVQAIARRVDAPWRELDLTALAGDEQRARLVSELADERHRRFDVTAAPLLRFTLIRLAPRRHVLVFTHHHILLDGWSLPLVLGDLFRLYAAGGDASALAPVVPLRDYLAWLADQDRAESENAWRAALDGLASPTLVAAGANTAEATLPKLLTVELPAELTGVLAGWARGCGLTLNSVVQGAWALLLGGLTGRGDVVFGATVAGRPASLAGVEDVVGLLMNTVPVRVCLSGSESVSGLLARVQREQSGLGAHHHVGLARIQRLAGLGELFDTSTVFENAPSEAQRFDLPSGLHVSPSDAADATAASHFPLALAAFPGERLRLELNYRPDVFGHDDAEAIARRLVAIFEWIAARPDTAVGRLPLLTEPERETILRQWNRTGRPVPQLTLPALFEQQAARVPNAPALLFEDETVTYADLNERANRLARVLVERGVGPERIVAIALPRSVEHVVAMLAVLKAGGAFLPIDLAYPAERVSFMLGDAAPAAVITRRGLLDADRVIELDDPRLMTAVASQAPGNLAYGERGEPRGLDDPAYVIYTSGSTGTPKGVVVTHRGIASMAAAQQQALGVGDGSRVLQFASPSFDAAVWELCMALLSGAALVLAPAERLLPGAALIELCERHAVTHATLPPTALTPLRESGALDPGVALVVAGEACPPDEVGYWSRDRVMINAYGPTETTVCATMSGPLSGAQNPPIGAPIVNSRVYVLDGSLRPVPPGVVGELYVGGAGLARGYLGRAGLTASRFVADPFAADGGRMYRTGDLAHWTSAGVLVFGGRVDDQVKVRGFRVELGEVEAALAQVTGVGRAIVVAREDRPGVKRLIGYVVPAPGERLDGVEVRSAVARRLPEYMVPAVVAVLDQLPLTTSGKVDRRALPAVAIAGSGSREPSGEIESALCALYAEVLGIEKVGVEDGFFDLGGDSIGSIQLVARARRAGLGLTPRDVFVHRTVAALARVVTAAADPASADRALLELDPTEAAELSELIPGVEEFWPATALHEGLIFHAQYDEDGVDVYNVQTAFDLNGLLDAAALRAACQGVVDRHAALRAGFVQRRSGQTIQASVRSVPVPFETVDLSPVAADEREPGLERLLAADRMRRFEMAAPPLVRFTLVRLGPERHVLLLTHHHILLDGWSLPLVLRDLFALYAGRGADLPQVVPYRDYLGWLAGQDRAAAEEAWRGALSGLAEPTLVADGHDVAHLSVLPQRLRGAWTEADTAALTGAAKARGLTLNTVVQGAWALLLNALTGRRDVVFGATVAGRPAEVPGVEEVVGLLMNTVPVRVRLDPRQSVATAFARLQESQAQLTAYHHLGLADIRRVAGLGDLFDTTTVFQNAPWNPEGLQDGIPGLSVDLLGDGSPQPASETEGTGAGDGTGATHYPLTLVTLPGERLRFELSYRPDVFTRDQAQGVLDRLGHLLRTVIEHFDAPLARVDLLTEPEQARLLGRWNDTARPVPEATLPELFETQVERTPAAVAVIDGERRLAYRELDAEADQLARALRINGVGPGHVVAVELPRGLELVVALYAVHRAGAAYLPIDPDLPRERIQFMLDDAAPTVRIDRAEFERLTALGASAQSAPPRVRPAPLDAAYVIYTSGSTGRPKGVVVAHEGIVNRLLWMQSQYPLGPDDRVLQKTPASFDVSVWEFFWPLLVGAALVMARPDGHKDPGYLAEAVQRHDVTTVHFVPSMLEAFLQAPQAAACTRLRRVFCSGEALPARLAERFHAVLPAQLHNLYGPTEASVDVTAFASRPATTTDPAEATTVPIGRPIANTRAYVLDPALRPLPPGTVGELYIAGTGLARGYLGRSTLTAERFVADPFGAPGSRMYRTGDLAHWTTDGDLVFDGRTDHQVKLRGFRIEPGEIEHVLAAHSAVGQAAVVAREDARGVARLIAYVVSPDTQDVDTASLREHAAAHLPDYMVPAAIIQLTELPLTPSGKLDRRALPEPRFAARAESRAPRTARERLLARLYAEVLGLDGERVGIDDDFFELGGDSIVSIQLAARARAQGLRLTPRDIFAHPAIAALALVARSADAATDEHPDAALGEVPLTPIAHWLRERGGPIDGFNQSVLLETPADLGLDALVTAVQALLDHHDALRMTLRVNEDDGAWSLHIPRRGSIAATECVTRVDIEELDDSPLRSLLAERARGAQAALDPQRGRLLRAVWFDAGPRRHGRLLIMIHHLAVDGVSWRILPPDLQTAWEAAVRGETPLLAPVPTSLRTWATRLHDAAQEPETVAEARLWTGIVEHEETLLTQRPFDPATDVHASARTLTLTLPAEDTAPLLTNVPAAFRARVDDVLLCALALAIGAWRNTRGQSAGDSVLIDLEGHGREDLEPETGATGEIDLTRTVGWFTSLYPVRLDVGDWTAVTEPGPELGRALKHTKEQLRALPRHGLGYGMLRYLNPSAAPALAEQGRAQLGFNYLGRFAAAEAAAWHPAAEADVLGAQADPNLPLAHPVELNALTEDHADGPRLTAGWTWGEGLLNEQDVRELAQLWFTALRALAACGTQRDLGGLTPSDVPLVAIGQDELEALEARAPHGVADLLPLTAVQEGLLFHAHYDSRAADVYNVQTVLDLEGPLNAARLRAACDTLVRRHAALRAAFILREHGEPVQAIAPAVPLPWRETDLRGLDPATALREADDFPPGDRARRFAPDDAPLLRFTLLLLPQERSRLVFTHHHLLLDGWSVPRLLEELVRLYAEGGDDAALPSPVPHRAHLAWLREQDRPAAELAWRRAMAGLNRPTLIAPAADPAATPQLPERLEQELPARLTADLAVCARGAGVTLNTLVQAAWALLLAGRTASRDVVFGVTVAGRPPELPGVEDILGLLINTVPARVSIDAREPVAELLGRVQREQSALSAYHHLGLADIQRIAGLGPLFDSTLVFQNYPRGSLAGGPHSPGTGLSGTGLRAIGFGGTDAYHYPLKLMAVPGDRLHLELSYRPDAVARPEAERIAAELHRLLAEIAADPRAIVGAIVDLPAGEPPAGDRSRPAAPYRAPATAWEQVLCDLYAAVLGVGRVGADDDFFALGGDSLKALRLVGRLRAQLRTTDAGPDGVPSGTRPEPPSDSGLDVRAVFDAPVVAALARHLHRLDQRAPEGPAR